MDLNASRSLVKATGFPFALCVACLSNGTGRQANEPMTRRDDHLGGDEAPAYKYITDRLCLSQPFAGGLLSITCKHMCHVMTHVGIFREHPTFSERFIMSRHNTHLLQLTQTLNTHRESEDKQQPAVWQIFAHHSDVSTPWSRAKLPLGVSLRLYVLG